MVRMGSCASRPGTRPQATGQGNDSSVRIVIFGHHDLVCRLAGRTWPWSSGSHNHPRRPPAAAPRPATLTRACRACSRPYPCSNPCQILRTSSRRSSASGQGLSGISTAPRSRARAASRRSIDGEAPARGRTMTTSTASTMAATVSAQRRPGAGTKAIRSSANPSSCAATMPPGLPPYRRDPRAGPGGLGHQRECECVRPSHGNDAAPAETPAGQQIGEGRRDRQEPLACRGWLPQASGQLVVQPLAGRVGNGHDHGRKDRTQVRPWAMVRAGYLQGRSSWVP